MCSGGMIEKLLCLTFRSVIDFEALLSVPIQIERASWAMPSNVVFCKEDLMISNVKV